MPDVSVIIACRNGAATLRETLESLVAQVWDGRWEIVLADNGSTDATAEIFADVARQRPDLVLRRVDASGRAGKSHALNVGIAAAGGRSLVFCDADDTVEPGWLAALAGALERHEFVACRMDLRRLNPDWVHAYRSRSDDMVLRRLSHAPFCALAGGGQFAFRRALFEDVGPFDEGFAVQEDHDYCIRAHLKGYQLHAVPEAVLNYRFRTDLGAIYRQSYSYARNRALLRRRYDPAPVLAPVAWGHLALRLARLAGGRLMRGLPGRSPSHLERARFRQRLGELLGDAVGAVRHGVAPRHPRRDARRMQAARLAQVPQ